MCGIAGSINFKLDLDSLKKSLYHRGPDEQSFYEYSNVSLFHSRLSIQDMTNGHQPYHYGDYSIIFNGEIYNHLELRKELKEFEFSTNSDTETLLKLYIKYKQLMFEKLDGMFAFCILDKKENKIILSKDRVGKKPLYLYLKEDKIVFASELNTIKDQIKDLKINENAIESYLRCGFFFQEFTAYEDIKNLKAGYSYEIDISTFEIKEKQYFNLEEYYNKTSPLSFKESLETLDSILHKSIKNRIESSDLEVGAFLSGGIDSSLIVAIATQYIDNLKTFTVSFEGSYDESSLAQLTANKYNTNHHKISISLDLKNDIEKILLNYGQPFMDSSAIPSYYVSKEAKKYVTVILNGDGADELFGGYRRYVPSANGILDMVSIFSFLTTIMPKPHNKKSLYNYFFRLLKMSDKKDLDFYLSSTTDIFEDEYTFNSNNIFEEMNKFIRNTSLNSLSKMLYLDANNLLFSDLLVKMDIATMANSIEGRSPFMSKYMLEFAPTLKNQYKIKGKKTKYILRELSKKYLSTELISQPKRGFEVPLKKWVENDLKENIFDYLSNNSYSSNFIEQNFIDKVLNKEINISDEKRAKMLWSMYCLEIWKKNQ